MRERTSTRASAPGTSNAQERILATATDLFSRYGYNGISTRHIASGAEVNEVTIYRRYPSKRDLYYAVLESELQQIHLRGEMLARLAEADSARAALDRTFELITMTFAQKPDLLRLVQFSILELTDVDQLLRKHLNELLEVIAGYLKPWIVKGELRSSNAKALVLTLVTIAFSHDTFHKLFSNNVPASDAMLQACAELCGCADR